ncbi:MAG TPA: alpha-amylase family glycosyl hydrolase [Caulobacteraceae bacterium]|nr:alpha-amylase family glycosyl hydrolase [Caulobacteraceae bacterium]
MSQSWWKTGIVYQIYPRSFHDSNGDGVGDLAGIRRRLGYLQELGVDAMWISPIFVSPMADFGYDVADYCAIDPLFGTLADFDALVAEAHARGMKLILDFVPNHTSEAHPWFREARAARAGRKRDWYIWRDGKQDGAPPNNWLSNFGGSAWEWDEATGQFYYHAFLKQQPDLNWRNPEVRTAMLDVLRFWLDRGVDGFRVDVLWHLIKDAGFRDNPPNPAFQPSQPGIERCLQLHSCDQPEVHEVVAEMRRVLDGYPDRVLIGEIYLPVERLVAYYGRELAGAHLPFNFQLLQTAWRADEVGRVVGEYEGLLPPGAWPNWVLGNHDRPRIASRVGPAQARVAAMLLFTLRGTPTLYYGDELGLEQVAIASDRVQDPWEKNEPGLGLGRDPCRTPMPWDASPNAGFSAASPWLPLNPDWETRNVAAEMADPASMLSLCRRLIALRRASPALTLGAYARVSADNSVLMFQRVAGAERILVALNFTHQPQAANLPAGDWTPVASTASVTQFPGQSGRLELAPDEGTILRATA